MKDLKVVYALIQNEEGNVLLVHNTDGGGWSLPGGKVEYGETLVEALKREVREETGLFVEVNDIVSVNEGKATIPNEVIDIQMKDEISTLGWFSIPEADEKLIYYHHSLNAFINNKATYCDEGFVD